MAESVEGRFEEIARKARRVQDAVERVRGSAQVAGVRVEVSADGRITALELADPVLAQAIRDAHARALEHASTQVAERRRELAEDPAVAAALRRFLEVGEAPAGVRTPADDPAAASTLPRFPEVGEVPADSRNAVDDWDDPGHENPYAFPPDLGRRY
ncbi:YbaB/EbfC family nucleoid-associated protein [Nocardia sp. NPDC051030]|uniref:YbaB/EbfC family nucleoid-associated protein n=1 Tax=Nocardia sp. NPDC051030 TaxID=3155162 RepID=UPI003444E4BB